MPGKHPRGCRRRRQLRHRPPTLLPDDAGLVRDVQYVGPVTRYHVTLDRGGELQVLAQNLEEGSSDVLELKGHRVRVEWRPGQESEIDESEGGSE